MTEADFLKSSGSDAVPRIFSEADFKFTKPEDFLYQRLLPDGTLKGKDPNLPPEVLRRFYEQLVFGRLCAKPLRIIECFWLSSEI